MVVVREVELEPLLGLRERVLTPGHPDRPVVWPYDGSATHFGMFDGDQLVGCVSLTLQEMPSRAAERPYHLHSMAVEPAYQGQGLGRQLLDFAVATVRERGGDLVWATSRPTAVAFYERCGFEAGAQMRVEPTKARMQYVWLR